MENNEKIKVATELLNTTKDYIELLKVAPKMKQTFNAEVINEQIKLNEKEIKENAEKLHNRRT